MGNLQRLRMSLEGMKEELENSSSTGLWRVSPPPPGNEKGPFQRNYVFRE